MWVKFVRSIGEDGVLQLGFPNLDAALKYATQLDEAMGG